MEQRRMKISGDAVQVRQKGKMIYISMMWKDVTPSTQVSNYTVSYTL